MCDEITLFEFQDVIMHAEIKMKEPSNILQSFLEVLSMFNIRILYDKGNVI